MTLPTPDEERAQLLKAMTRRGIRITTPQRDEVLSIQPRNLLARVAKIDDEIDPSNAVGICLLLRNAETCRPDNRVGRCAGTCGRLVQWSPTMPATQKMCAWCAEEER